MFQQSEYDLTNVEVHFKELNENSGYHVHIVRNLLFDIGSRTEELILPFRHPSKVIWSFHVKIPHYMVIGIPVKLIQRNRRHLAWARPMSMNWVI